MILFSYSIFQLNVRKGKALNTYTHSIRTKNERAEQFSKRMHKEGQLTKAQKDEIRAKNMAQRDIYE